MQLLERRGLIKQHPFRGRHADSSAYGTLVHLAGFAPKLAPGQLLQVMHVARLISSQQHYMMYAAALSWHTLHIRCCAAVTPH